jgi:hypothetical protein
MFYPRSENFSIPYPDLNIFFIPDPRYYIKTTGTSFLAPFGFGGMFFNSQKRSFIPDPDPGS